jgi:tRNA (Thr-GGU) A37 N-methylase
MQIQMKPIAFVKNDINKRMDADWGAVQSDLVLEEDYIGALKGLEDFTDAIILTYLHEAHYDRNKHLQRRPRNMETMPLVGIFPSGPKTGPTPSG